MLLVPTDALCAHLGAASSRLPDEVWAAVAEHLTPSRDQDKGLASQRTIPHKVLVAVGKWATTQTGKDRGKLGAGMSPLRGLSRVRPGLTQTRLLRPHSRLFTH